MACGCAAALAVPGHPGVAVLACAGFGAAVVVVEAEAAGLVHGALRTGEVAATCAAFEALLVGASIVGAAAAGALSAVVGPRTAIVVAAVATAVAGPARGGARIRRSPERHLAGAD